MTEGSFLFHGIPMRNIEIVQPLGDFRIMPHYTPLSAIRARPDPVTATFCLGVNATRDLGMLQALSRLAQATELCPQSLIALGPGYTCKYCGNFNVSGVFECIRCGGETERYPFLTPHSIDYVLRLEQAEYSSLIDYTEASWVYCEMAFPEWRNEFLDVFAGGYSLDTIQHGLSLTGYYLCGNCGNAVEDEKTCPDCGGVRIPWSEIVRMDRDCLYCGAHIKSGVLCSGCGAKLTGLTYKMASGAMH